MKILITVLAIVLVIVVIFMYRYSMLGARCVWDGSFCVDSWRVYGNVIVFNQGVIEDC